MTRFARMKIRNLCKQVLHESTDLTVSFALKNTLELRRILHRLTHDEEDLLIPALLHSQVQF